MVADQGFNLHNLGRYGRKEELEYEKNLQVLHVDVGNFTVVGCESVSRRLCL